MLEDSLDKRMFADVKSKEDFYFKLGAYAGDKLRDKNNTLIFIDEIQTYPELLTLLKFLFQDNRYKYIANGSLLGVTLSETSSIPMGSINKIRMYPMDFEEFLYANNFSFETIDALRNKFNHNESLDEAAPNMLLKLFKKYLLVGGLPAAVQSYVDEINITKVRQIHDNITEYYKTDASKYDIENNLKIERIYNMIPSNLENKKKRVFIKDIENIKGKTYSNYIEEFDYLISSGIFLEVKAVTNPFFPLVSTSTKKSY